jgi:hypothetical protein
MEGNSASSSMLGRTVPMPARFPLESGCRANQISLITAY